MDNNGNIHALILYKNNIQQNRIVKSWELNATALILYKNNIQRGKELKYNEAHFMR